MQFYKCYSFGVVERFSVYCMYLLCIVVRTIRILLTVCEPFDGERALRVKHIIMRIVVVCQNL